MSRLFEKIEIPKIDLSETEKAIKNIWAEIDRIAKDIQEQKDNAIAMEFTKCIGELLKKNGVVPKITEYTRNFETDKTFETRYGVSIDELDFSEHDSMLKGEIEKLKSELEYEKRNINYLRTRCMEDATDAFDSRAYGRLTIVGRRVDLEAENEKLRQRIAELESKEVETVSDIDTSNPIACAESLIEHMTHYEKFMIMPERDVQTFSVEELKEIADYLMVYYRHHRDRDAGETISF